MVTHLAVDGSPSRHYRQACLEAGVLYAFEEHLLGGKYRLGLPVGHELDTEEQTQPSDLADNREVQLRLQLVEQ